MTASRWYATLPTPTSSFGLENKAGPHLRRFTGTPPHIDQPALCDNVLAMHLGGPKRVHRLRGSQGRVTDVDMGSLTMIPAHHEYRWRTEGPIDYAHVTLSAGLVSQVCLEEFDRDWDGLEFHDLVGFHDPLAERMFNELLGALSGECHIGRLYADSLLVVLCVALVRRRSSLAASGGSRPSRAVIKGGLTGLQLRRVVDYMEQHLGRDIALAELTGLTCLSRAQFFRSFKQTTGTSPNRFLTRLRLKHARGLLERTDLPLEMVATRSGMASIRQFAAAFHQACGISPRQHRASFRPSGSRGASEVA